jgi:formamidopyrimidine-DNA glycosylase
VRYFWRITLKEKKNSEIEHLKGLIRKLTKENVELRKQLKKEPVLIPQKEEHTCKKCKAVVHLIQLPNGSGFWYCKDCKTREEA